VLLVLQLLLFYAFLSFSVRINAPAAADRYAEQCMGLAPEKALRFGDFYSQSNTKKNDRGGT